LFIAGMCLCISLFFLYECAGISTREMLALPKSWFMLIGLLEVLGVDSGNLCFYFVTM
jgi:hypothetical protein